MESAWTYQKELLPLKEARVIAETLGIYLD